MMMSVAEKDLLWCQGLAHFCSRFKTMGAAVNQIRRGPPHSNLHHLKFHIYDFDFFIIPPPQARAQVRRQ
jgi:hypothetical protein